MRKNHLICGSDTPEFKLTVPTYNAIAFAEDVESGTIPEFGPPYVPVLIQHADGVRVALGSHDNGGIDMPDLQIEKRPGGWAIFLHPVGGSDPCGYIYFLNDGRSILLKERTAGSAPAIEIRESNEEVDEIDIPCDESTEHRSDDELLNAFSDEIGTLENLIQKINDKTLRLRLFRIANNLTSIIREI